MYTGPDKFLNREKLERILGSPFHLQVQVCEKESCVDSSAILQSVKELCTRFGVNGLLR